MGSCDDYNSSGWQSGTVVDATEQDDQSHLLQLDTEQEESWAGADEGYTPLTDVDLTSHYLLVSPGTTGNLIDDSDAAGESEAVAMANMALSALHREYEHTFQNDFATTNNASQNPGSAIENGSARNLEDGSRMRDTLPSLFSAEVNSNHAESDPSTFIADWDIARLSILPTASESAVDTDTVRRAVEEISESTRDSPFQRRFAAWSEHEDYHNKAHQVVPRAPLSAFLRSSTKAKQATASLTRSATIAEALVRLQHQGILDISRNYLLIDVVGVDQVECETVERIQTMFRPIVRWVGVWKAADYKAIHLRLIGRDLSSAVSEKRINLLSQNARTDVVKADATCYSEICYHDWHSQHQVLPALIIAFNAGIWGYTEWAPTISYLRGRIGMVPMVITAYTVEEAEEDMEVIQNTVPGNGAKLLWYPEMNPFGSNVIRETKSSSSEYRENSSWQAWIFGSEAVSGT